MNLFKKNLISLLILAPLQIFAQHPFVINGNAAENNCNCYTLTPDADFQIGSVWNRNKINLNDAFSYRFKIFLGCNADGADGLTFTLQRDTTAIGKEGAGMGFQDIDSSLAVVIDTYQNAEQNDPPYDHVSITSNGDVFHYSANNLAGPVQALSNSTNIKDCNWHLLQVDWQPADSTLKVSMDGVLRLTLQKDIVHSIFNNLPEVYWGFTASTGSVTNVQQVCTFNTAGFYTAPSSAACTNTPFNFTDTSSSFGSITNWYWNFGDNSVSNNQNPQHIYKQPGVYTATLHVTGNDGCYSDTVVQSVTVNPAPVANFTNSMSTYCIGANVTFTNSTNLNNTTPESWYWNFGDGTTSSLQNPPLLYYKPGAYAVQLKVESTNGCSDSILKSVSVQKTSLIDFDFTNGCKNTALNFNGKSLVSKTPVSSWYWNFDDGSFAQGAELSHTYPYAGIYNVKVYGVTDNGCFTDTATKQVSVYEATANAGNDTTVILNYPFQLHATGGDNYTWSPSLGLNNPFIANPVATLNDDITYYLTVTTNTGCSAKDTLHLKVAKGPEIYVPTAFTPNGDGKNDRYKIFPVGITEIVSFKIYSRWGQLVYASLNASEGWDGTISGNPQPPGTYIWLVAGKTFEGKLISKRGTLVLIR